MKSTRTALVVGANGGIGQALIEALRRHGWAIRALVRTAKHDDPQVDWRIGDAMNQFDGPVLVAGHTDNVPLSGARRMRFPTNWHLSQARAEAVAAVVGSRLKRADRIRAEGRSDTEPKASNDTAEGRAQNRRVDVTLLNASH